MAQDDSEVLRAGFDVAFTYTRSVGPVIGAFLTGLRDRKLTGIKGSRGQIICPPTEYDPDTSEELNELVDLPETGTVTTWAWVNEPRPKNHLDKPFAWALVKIDGTETPMLHMVDAGSEDNMSTGMKVKVRWAEETHGFITDIACFEPA